MSAQEDSEKLLFRGGRFNVHSLSVKLPDGRMIEKQVIRHPGAVVLVPVLDDGRLVMIRNYRYSVGKHLLELPAGTMEPDESPQETAARELTEETGYTADRIQYLQSFYAAPGNCDEEMHLFLASGLTETQPDREIGEQIVNEVLDWKTLDEKIASGEINDAKTLIGLLLWQRTR